MLQVDLGKLLGLGSLSPPCPPQDLGVLDTSHLPLCINGRGWHRPSCSGLFALSALVGFNLTQNPLPPTKQPCFHWPRASWAASARGGSSQSPASPECPRPPPGTLLPLIWSSRTNLFALPSPPRLSSLHCHSREALPACPGL